MTAQETVPSLYIEFERWQDAPTDPESWPWRNFPPEELACSHTGRLRLHRPSIDRLQAVRDDYGRPMPISSAFRDPTHPSEARKRSRSGAHVKGQGFDVQVSGGEALALTGIALAHGFTGIGWNQKGKHGSRFVHLDDAEGSSGQPRPAAWSY